MGDRIQPGAIAGAAGSVVSQGAAIAMGVQDKFSWNAVALSALGSGVSAGLSQVGPLAAIKGWEGAALRGMASNAITQGVGVATGMQDKFSWAGVAVAGVVSGVGYAVADAIGGMFGGNPSRLESLAIDGASNLAGGIAGAAALSLIEGSDFGDNMMAVLPDVIGATIGNMIAGGVSARGGTGRKDEKASGALDFLSDAAGAVGDFLGFDGRFGYQGAEGRELSLGGIGQAFQSVGDEEGRLYRAPPIIPVEVRELAPIGYMDSFGNLHPGGAQGRYNPTSVRAAPAPAVQYLSDIWQGTINGWKQGAAGYQPRTPQDYVQMAADPYGVGRAINLIYQPVKGAISAASRPLFSDGPMDAVSDRIAAETNQEHPFFLDPNHVPTAQERADSFADLVIGVGTAKVPFGAAPKVVGELEGGANIVYRGMTAADAEAFQAGQGLLAKAPDGTWTAAEHVANAGPGAGGAAGNSPWISTSRTLDVAQAYDSGHGVVAIDLSKVDSFQVEVWQTAPRVNGVDGLAYHRSIWGQEVTIYRTIPPEAIIGKVPAGP